MNNIKLIANMVKIANRLEKAGGERTAQLITKVLERSYRHAIGFMDDIASQDPFDHFHYAYGISDPRPRFERLLNEYALLDYELEDVVQIIDNQLEKYLRDVGDKMSDSQNDHSQERTGLLNKVREFRKELIGSINSKLTDDDLTDTRKQEVQSVIPILKQSLGGESEGSTPESSSDVAPVAGDVTPETPQPVTPDNSSVSNLSPEAPDEPEQIFDVPSFQPFNPFGDSPAPTESQLPDAPGAVDMPESEPVNEAPLEANTPDSTEISEVPKSTKPNADHLDASLLTDSVKQEVMNTLKNRQAGYVVRKAKIDEAFGTLYAVMNNPGDWESKSVDILQQFEKLSTTSNDRGSAAYMAKIPWANIQAQFKALVHGGDQKIVQDFLEGLQLKVQQACDTRILDVEKAHDKLEEAHNDEAFLAIINGKHQDKLRRRIKALLTKEGVISDPATADLNTDVSDVVPGEPTEAPVPDVPQAVTETPGFEAPEVSEAESPEAVNPEQTQQTQSSPGSSLLNGLYKVFGEPGEVQEHIGQHLIGMTPEGQFSLNYINALRQDMADISKNGPGDPKKTYTARFMSDQVKILRTRFTSGMAAVRDLRGLPNADHDNVNKAWVYLETEVDPILSYFEMHGSDMSVQSQAAQLERALPTIEAGILDTYPEGPMRDEARRHLDDFQAEYSNASEAGHVPAPDMPVDHKSRTKNPVGDDDFSPNHGNNNYGAPSVSPGHNPAANPYGATSVPAAPQHASAPVQPAQQANTPPQPMDDETRKYMSLMMSSMLGLQMGQSLHHGLFDHAQEALTANAKGTRLTYGDIFDRIDKSTV